MNRLLNWMSVLVLVSMVPAHLALTDIARGNGGMAEWNMVRVFFVFAGGLAIANLIKTRLKKSDPEAE